MIENTIKMLESITNDSELLLGGYDFFLGNIKSKYNKYVYFSEVFDGQELIVEKLINISFKGQKETRILTPAGYAAVITFNNVDNILLDTITLGHVQNLADCNGDVLKFYSCKNIVLSKLDLFGCGTYGINLDECEDVTVEGCVIHNCTHGIATLLNCERVTFKDCKFIDNRSKNLFISHCDQVIFDNCVFEYNDLRWFSSENAILCLHDSCGKIVVQNCEYYSETIANDMDGLEIL